MRLERKRACGHCGARAWHPAPTPLRYVIAFGPSQSLSSPNACVGRRVWRTAASCDAVGLLVILWCSSLQRMVRAGATAVVCRRRAVHACEASGCVHAAAAGRGQLSAACQPLPVAAVRCGLVPVLPVLVSATAGALLTPPCAVVCRGQTLRASTTRSSSRAMRAPALSSFPQQTATPCARVAS